MSKVRGVPEWNGLQIPVGDLRRVFERILEHVEQTTGETVTLHEDYFYSLPAPELYDVGNDAPEPTIGQLTESWDNLTSHSDSDWTVNWEFVWLGDILRAVGHLLPEGGSRSVGQ